jgi:hypothetical protein
MEYYFNCIYDFFKSTYDSLLNLKLNFFYSANVVPPHIKVYINENIDIKKIDIKNKSGDTGYIDFIIKEDFPVGSNVVYGYDKFNRFFLSVLYCETKRPEYYHVMTIFERYSNDPHLIVSAGYKFIENVVATWNLSLDRMDSQIANFFKLINDGMVDVEYFDNNDLTYKSIQYKLYDNYNDEDEYVNIRL